MITIFIAAFILLAGLAMVASIIIPKLPQLANLDLENLPLEQEARKKKQIIQRLITSQGEHLAGVWSIRLKPFKKWWGQLQLQFRIYVGKIERLWHHEQKTIKQELSPVEPKESTQQKLIALLEDAQEKLHHKKYDQAEGLFIAAIKIDSKSVRAYRGLADTYLAKGAIKEAEETYLFLLQLEPENDLVMVKIADIAESDGDLLKAIDYYERAVIANDSLSPRFYHLAELLLREKQPETAKEAIIQAAELEPRNPKYLDLLIEIVILCGDKELAKRAYHDLRLVNPKNKKLKFFYERIQRL